MPSFFAVGFAIAGAIAATGPFIIHLLNRRRFRVVNWAAMDFLREAMKRNRRVLQLRDLLLLVLRTVCVLLFGLAMARPFFRVGASSSWFLWLCVAIGAVGVVGFFAGFVRRHAPLALGSGGLAAIALMLGLYTANNTSWGGREVAADDARVHAVLVLDNSLSMGYRYAASGVKSASGGEPTLLDEARHRARELVERLPEGSWVSVLPLCGGSERISRDVYRTKDDALDALDQVRVVDRTGEMGRAAELAVEACKLAPERPAKRVVFFGDQQADSWPTDSLAELFPGLPEMQVVALPPEAPANAWIESFRLQDDLADTETESRFIVRVGYQGDAPREDVKVTLAIRAEVVSEQYVKLEQPQGEDAAPAFRLVEFPPYRFVDVEAEQGKARFVDATVSLGDPEWDGLPGDNARYLSAPVVAALPVVFIDEYGDRENPRNNQYGQTFRLRRLLAPRTSRSEQRKQLVRVVHRRLEDLAALDALDEEGLKDPERNFLRQARLVVVAGIEAPSEAAVRVLRQYVKQGGQLLFAAGGEFNPAAWNEVAWREGGGILPLPLEPVPVGRVPTSGAPLPESFTLDFDSMLNSDYFLVPGETKDYLKSLYTEPFFFKAVVADAHEDRVAALVESERQRVAEEQEFLREFRRRERQWAEQEAEGTLTEQDEFEREQLLARKNEIDPEWLRLRPEADGLAVEADPGELADRTRPRVLAYFDKQAAVAGEPRQLPFLVERDIGHGQVLFATSGVFVDWNSLTFTDAALIYDRICRSMIHETLPRRNFEAEGELRVPMQSIDRLARFTLSRPGQPTEAEEDLPLSALGADREGFVIRDAFHRGHYRVKAYPAAQSAQRVVTDAALWELPLAVNEDASPRQDESRLAYLNETEFSKRVGDEHADRFGWVARDEPISLQGPGISGHDLWWWFMFAVFTCLLVELSVLAWPTVAGERT